MDKRYFIAEWEIDNDNPDYFPSFIKINNGQLTLLSEVDSADVGAVQHGKWIVTGKTTKYWTCSECGKAGDEWDKFCRNCGAKMDEEDGDE